MGENYPEHPPEVTIHHSQGMSDNQLVQLEMFINHLVAKLAGDALVAAAIAAV